MDVIATSNADRVPELVPIRHQRMSASPFTFFRGAADIMAADLAPTPRTGISAQLCGDCHLSNFGLFATPERNVIFDVNDFDETARGPWEWDVKRLVASLEIAARESGFDDRARRRTATRTARSYRTHLWEYAELGPLETRYDRRDLDQLIALARDSSERKARTAIGKKARRHGSERMVARLTETVDGELKIKDDPPLLSHPPEDDWREIALEFLDAYRATLRPETRIVFDRFHLVDVALKVGGIGSVGTRCFLGLFLSDDDHPLFLQVKEAGDSALAPYADPGGPEHAGERVVVGQRIMQGASDMFLGWGTGRAGRRFYVRQAQDMKYSLDVGSMTRGQLETYGDGCGWVLARSHAVSSDAATIAGYLGQGTTFDEALADFAVTYADQNERDFAAFTAATASGRLPI
ncbi:MAG: DUF2252 domain-containing protein [Acidimicrobiia bacterium]